MSEFNERKLSFSIYDNKPISKEQSAAYIAEFLDSMPVSTIAAMRETVLGFPTGKTEITKCIGICNNLDKFYPDTGKIVTMLASRSWQYYSGDIVYPVGGRKEYDAMRIIGNTAKWEGKSGWKRARLCHHIARILQLVILSMESAK